MCNTLNPRSSQRVGAVTVLLRADLGVQSLIGGSAICWVTLSNYCNSLSLGFYTWKNGHNHRVVLRAKQGNNVGRCLEKSLAQEGPGGSSCCY